MQSKENIAIIFFSRKASQDGRYKDFVSNKKSVKNKTISASFIAKTQQTLEATNIPVYHFHQGNQTGNTFGEKLANAYQEIFNLGYEGIIAVGNDSPELANANWNDIQNKLSKGDSVLGPSLRGGTYLIGLTKETFNKQAFASLPWQTHQLFDELSKLCESKAQVHILERIRDINTYSDLKLFIKKASIDLVFKKIIQYILNLRTEEKVSLTPLFITSPLLIGSPFRAPPLSY
ncbi:DUF2064 domain-containing protein [Marivirga sp. S37H4]|uniref:DUF2064 domain-containing protein n=1 Tax=Marivirga aurantiaca TaxID=2802615 RepID=A0A934WWA9_9BACT|nr:DUF2064 domain-containing protein [Marivirga aurantiaca]MBK6264111.1 DUF2064 domain-containing protein [Marivirga aurantiaca]